MARGQRGGGAKKRDNKNLIKIAKGIGKGARYIPGVRLIGDAVNAGKKVHKKITKTNIK